MDATRFYANVGVHFIYQKKENVSIIAAVAYPEHSFQDSRGATANSE